MKIKNFLKFFAGIFAVPMLFASCEEQMSTNTLSVEPSGAITFLASGNEPVLLTVTTDADSWDYTAPEWIEAVKDGNTLTVNALDNTTGGSRSGRIEFTAGNADRVNVVVMQDSQSGGNNPGGDGISASVLDSESGTNDVNVSVSSTSPELALSVKIVLESPAASDMDVKLVLDPEYTEEYSYTHDDLECVNFPESGITLANDGVVSISAGETESEPLSVELDGSSLEMQTNYLVSLVVDEASCPSGISFSTDGKRVNWLVKKKLPKEIKNVVYLEVNNTNPLNLLEYKLEDGTPFFDVAILFAANINYDGENDIVYLHNNPNVQALLTETEVYIQPLREAGIEVQLGLLPNHTPAGLLNLSVKGAQMFAADVANACAQYGLDGCSMDEEYRSGSSGSDLFNPPTSGMYLCYELKKAFEEQCDWPCQISVFDFGWSWSMNGVPDGYTAGDLVDFHVANYGGSSSPRDGMTLKDCSGKSIECNRGYECDLTESEARQMKENGYGWCMWFAFHPQVGGGLTNNAPRIDPLIEAAARGFYDQELQEPTGYYTKIGEGQYDPTRHQRTW